MRRQPGGGLMTMRRTLLVGIAASMIFSLSVGSQTPARVGSALTGRVTSAAEGAMEGVLVSAKREGSNMTITVVSNASGAYAFPQDRLAPGRYAVSIRAAGYRIAGAGKDRGGHKPRLPLNWTCAWNRQAFWRRHFSSPARSGCTAIRFLRKRSSPLSETARVAIASRSPRCLHMTPGRRPTSCSA